jgi:hypothetical protein
LRKQRTERAAGHDDRALGAERAAGADGDRRRERLEYRHFRLDPALADKDRLDCLGDTVTANFLRSEIGEQSDRDAAGDRDSDCPQRQAIAGQVDRLNRKPVQIGNVGEERNQFEQHPGGTGAGSTGDQRHRRQQQDSRIGGEIAQRIIAVDGLLGSHIVLLPTSGICDRNG